MNIPYNLGEKVYFIQVNERSHCFICNSMRWNTSTPRVVQGEIRSLYVSGTEENEVFSFGCSVGNTNEAYSVSKVFKNRKDAEEELKKQSVSHSTNA